MKLGLESGALSDEHVAQIKTLAEGNVDFLPEDAMYRFRLFNKISFLHSSVVEDQYLKWR